MADFPPNLDDGEFWLPSDICREISHANHSMEGQSKGDVVNPITPTTKQHSDEEASSKAAAAEPINCFSSHTMQDPNKVLGMARGEEIYRYPVQGFTNSYRCIGTGVYIPHLVSSSSSNLRSPAIIGVGPPSHTCKKLPDDLKKKGMKNGEGSGNGDFD